MSGGGGMSGMSGGGGGGGGGSVARRGPVGADEPAEVHEHIDWLQVFGEELEWLQAMGWSRQGARRLAARRAEYAVWGESERVARGSWVGRRGRRRQMT